MSGSDWGKLTAFIGCLIGAAALWLLLQPGEPRLPTYESAQKQDPDYRPGGASCNPLRLGSLPDREAAIERERCEEAAEQHRLQSNDLIQQARSADAARETVALSYNQSLVMLAGTIVGFLTLAAAAAAAFYAMRAAQYTRETLEAERAWLTYADISKFNTFSTTVIDESGESMFINNGYAFQIHWGNSGRSPAKAKNCWIRAVAVAEGEIPAFPDETLEAREIPFVVAAGSSISTTRHYVGDEDATLFRAGKVVIFIHSRVNYFDIWNEPRWSEVTLRLRHQGGTETEISTGRDRESIEIQPVDSQSDTFRR